jgi:signal peptidase II
VRLAHSENVGAFMGLGASLPPASRTLIFGVFAAVLLISVTAYAFTAPNMRRLGVVATSLLVAGGLGNLVDRITRQGAVTDFLNIGVGQVRTGVFNVADLAIVLGVALLILSSRLGEQRLETSPGPG